MIMTSQSRSEKSNKENTTEQPKSVRKPLPHRDAEAACPEDYSICGEEDPGSALESLVNNDKK